MSIYNEWHKYGAKAVTIDGHLFRSTKEGNYYKKLKILLNAGKITDLELEPTYNLTVNGEHICKFKPDFKYKKNGIIVIQDCKGYKKGTAWTIFQMKCRLLKGLYGLTVEVV